MSSWIKRLFKKEKSKARSVVGVDLTPVNAAWCQIAEVDSHLKIQGGRAISDDFKSPADAMQALIETASLPNSDCYITLGHQYYNLLLVDAPPVPDQELRDAVRWKVKDLIAEPIDKVVVDAFRLPEDAYRGRMNMVYVAVIDSKVVKALLEVCEQADIDVCGINITELAMAAMTSEMRALQQRSVAMLYLNGQSGTINLIENGHLYLTRNIEVNAGSGGYTGNLDFQQDPVDNLALDVQRSLDYYESQIGKSGVSCVYLVSSSAEHNGWLEILQQRLPVKVELCQVPSDMMTEGSDFALPAGAVAAALGAAVGGLRDAV
ncbi:hypothetical protein FT643_17215 [Ketobacter sp. MCCC 1A13808]|uniref:hypothetical protein n=1 Tax=Ketobacter sp. MCCC 1A13808 TaxID=2602738 RepID=UPI000F2676FC|nr:hypothetical protein [Ketobacter sp. MCCC 1A13808]MVF13884.1 hypothetical protein [Ketobacter sp. MCCC 1A13808]RLP54934.1 MAG: hypothetical protein D6160_08985 [Ketobacter sp.]